MSRNKGFLFIVLVLWCGAELCFAEKWVKCHVVNLSGAPVKGITVEVVASKPPSIPTDRSGYTKILVKDSVKVDQEIEIEFIDPSHQYALLIPDDRRIKAPPPDGFATIVLAKPGDIRILQHGKVMVQIAATVLARGDRLARGSDPLPEDEARIQALKDISENLGFAASELSNALRAWAKGAKQQYEVGVAALYEGKYARAAEALKTSFKQKYPTFFSLRESTFQSAKLWGLAAMKNHDYKEAATAFSNALEVQPGALNERELLGDCFFELKQYAEAEEQYSKLTKQDEDNEYAAEGYERLARVFEAQGRMTEAATALFDAAETVYDNEYPEGSLGWYQSVADFLEKHGTDDALLDTVYEKIIEVQEFANERPEYDEETAEKLVNLRIKRRDFGLAANVYEDAIEWGVYNHNDPQIRKKIDELNAKQKLEDQQSKAPK